MSDIDKSAAKLDAQKILSDAKQDIHTDFDQHQTGNQLRADAIDLSKKGLQFQNQVIRDIDSDNLNHPLTITVDGHKGVAYLDLQAEPNRQKVNQSESTVPMQVPTPGVIIDATYSNRGDHGNARGGVLAESGGVIQFTDGKEVTKSSENKLSSDGSVVVK